MSLADVNDWDDDFISFSQPDGVQLHFKLLYCLQACPAALHSHMDNVKTAPCWHVWKCHYLFLCSRKRLNGDTFSDSTFPNSPHVTESSFKSTNQYLPFCLDCSLLLQTPYNHTNERLMKTSPHSCSPFRFHFSNGFIYVQRSISFKTQFHKLIPCEDQWITLVIIKLYMSHGQYISMFLLC